VNLQGQILCAHRVLPAMIARRCGRIINIASGGGATMLPYFSAYVTSKTAALIEDVRNHDSQVRSSSDRPPSWSLLPSARPMSCRDATYIPGRSRRLIEEAREIEARKLYSLQVQRL